MCDDAVLLGEFRVKSAPTGTTSPPFVAAANSTRRSTRSAINASDDE
jgi:hypothetical protein